MTRTVVAAGVGLVAGIWWMSDDEAARPPPSIAATARACAHDGDLSCPRPIFTVRNLQASQRYYRDALGFQMNWDHGEPPDFASVSRGDTEIFLCQGCRGAPGGWMMSFSPDVDRLYRELRDKDARILMPPTDMPWGLRELHVADLDGNVMRIGSGIEH